jgi:hypothetical protein
MRNDHEASKATSEPDTCRTPSDGGIAAGRRVRFVGDPGMTTWSKPCIGATGRLTRRNVTMSKWTGNEVVLWVFESEIPGKCLPAWMYVRAGEVRVIGEDVPSQGEASLLGDCSYDAMLRKAGIDQSFLHVEPAPGQVPVEAIRIN